MCQLERRELPSDWVEKVSVEEIERLIEETLDETTSLHERSHLRDCRRLSTPPRSMQVNRPHQKDPHTLNNHTRIPLSSIKTRHRHKIVLSKISEYLEDPRVYYFAESLDIYRGDVKMLLEDGKQHRELNDYIILAIAYRGKLT